MYQSPAPPPPPKRIEPPPTFDDLEGSSALDLGLESIEIGTLVSLKSDGIPIYGVVRWIGCLPESDLEMAGIELVKI